MLQQSNQDDLSGCSIELQFGFDKLKGKDLLTKSDPFAQIETYDDRRKAWYVIGKTSVAKDTHSGSWPESFKVRFLFEEQQSFRIKVWDYDQNTNHDFMGEASFHLGDVMGSIGQRMNVALNARNSRSKDNGILKIFALKDSSEGNGILSLKLRAHKLDSKDWGGLGRSDPYFILQRKAGENDWVSVYKSEFHKSNNNPVWNVMSIDLQKLCNSDRSQQVRIRVYDYDDGTQDDLIGDAYVTVNELLAKNKSFDVKHPPTKAKYQKASYKRSGVIEVMESSMRKLPTAEMLDFIAGGLEINLIVAVDFTGSNGDPREPRSLHYRNPNAMNQYQSAIHAVGSILSSYDHDGRIPAFGFGGSINNGTVDHCFPLNLLQDPNVLGVHGLMEAYGHALERVGLSGPTYFAPLLARTNQLVYNPEISQSNQTYSVLLILTDGAICDIEQTIQQIRQLANSPISIVIVGVGNADFSKMNILDGDEHPIASRDIVQFVPYNRMGSDPFQLARETLKEIPHQLVDFFSKRNIKPNPPRQPVETSEVVASVVVTDGDYGGVTVPQEAVKATLVSSGRDLLRTAYQF